MYVGTGSREFAHSAAAAAIMQKARRKGRRIGDSLLLIVLES